MITTQPPHPPQPVPPLEHAKNQALAALTGILADPDASHRERRLAAVAILKFATAAEPKPRATPPSSRDTKPPRSSRTRADAEDHAADTTAFATECAELIDTAYDRGYSDAAANRPHDPPDPPTAAALILARRFEAAEREYAATHDPDDPGPPLPRAT